MNNLFLKLTSNFKINLDLDEMLSKFGPEVLPKPETGAGYVHEFKNQEYVYWQNYFNGTAFARGLYTVFPKETSNILEQICLLQQTITDDATGMSKIFKNATITQDRLYLVRIKGKTNAEPHIDGNRKISLNVGLRNSSSRQTIISEDKELKNFWKSKLHMLQMEDGHAYLLNTAHPHAVRSTTAEGWQQPRYLISYSVE